MKILLLTQWFDPEPTFKGLVFAKALRDENHHVEVITGFPNYPGGDIYDGYKVRFIQKEIMDGIQVTRLPLYPSHDNSGVRRALNYISFATSVLFYGLFKSKSADVIYVYHPPLTVGVAAAAIGIFRKMPFVYDIQDLWPDSLLATGMIKSKLILGLTSKICTWVYERAAHIVVLSNGFRERLVERGVPPEKITVIRNWCDEDALRSTSGAVNSLLPRGFNVLFAGNIGRAQALESVIDAAEICAPRNAAINFVFVGNGNEKARLVRIVEEKGLTNVTFLPRVAIDEIGQFLVSADALLVHLRANELFRITIPSKTQAYLAMGRPIIMAVEGDAANLVMEAEAGMCCRSENPNELANTILELAATSPEKRQMMGQSGLNYYRQHLALRQGTRQFIRVFELVHSKFGV